MGLRQQGMRLDAKRPGDGNGRRDGRVRSIESVGLVDPRHRRPRDRPEDERFAHAAAGRALLLGFGRVAASLGEAREPAREQAPRERTSGLVGRVPEAVGDRGRVDRAVRERCVAGAGTEGRHEPSVEGVDGGFEGRYLPRIAVGRRGRAGDLQVRLHRVVGRARRVDAEGLGEGVRERFARDGRRACRRAGARREGSERGKRRAEPGSSRSHRAPRAAVAAGAAGTRRTVRCMRASTRCTQARHLG